MFERFTDRARRVIVLAQDAARDMGHARIQPEHLLVGLQEGTGLAATAMSQAGVDGAALRSRVASRYKSVAAAAKVDKIPFSAEAKKCLEHALRAALGLGHNYIGTEHLFFGVQRRAESDGWPIDEVLGVSAADVHRRITEQLATATGSPSLRSPALQAAFDHARSRAGKAAMTTGDVLRGMLVDMESQVSRALTALGVDAPRVHEALDAVDVAATSDASPAPQSLTVTIGDTTTVVADPAIAAELGKLSTDQLRDLLRDAIDRRRPDGAAS